MISTDDGLNWDYSADFMTHSAIRDIDGVAS